MLTVPPNLRYSGCLSSPGMCTRPQPWVITWLLRGGVEVNYKTDARPERTIYHKGFRMIFARVPGADLPSSLPAASCDAALSMPSNPNEVVYHQQPAAAAATVANSQLSHDRHATLVPCV